MTKRYRPSIPTLVKLDIIIRQEGKCGCGCGEKLGTLAETEFDHCPALALRAYDPETRTYDPPANDPTRIIAKRKVHHRDKTSHPRGPHTSLGSDQHLIAKLNPKRVEHFVVHKKPIGGEGPREHGGATSQDKARSRWPSPKLQSRGFQKTHKPMRPKRPAQVQEETR